jgi:PIN domain nuclease of toxin-antitoxin system
MGSPERLKLLLDTHIWLWMLLEPNRLEERVANHLRDSDHELWLSPISVWEATLLAEKGRLVLDLGPFEGIRDALRAIPIREATLNREVALASREINVPHQDPADRFIGATAKVYGLTLVTQDERLLKSGDFEVLANRAGQRA